MVNKLFLIIFLLCLSFIIYAQDDDEVIIRTFPDKAYIYIDNKYIGKSPLSLKGIEKYKIYKLKIEKWGYKDIEKQIKLSDYRKLEVNLQRESIRKRYPNAIFLNFLGEPLFLGLEYVRFVEVLFGYIGISGGAGSWLLGSSFHCTARLIVGKYNRIALYIGSGFIAYVYKELNAFVISYYLPAGMMISVTERILLSFEYGFWVVSSGYVTKDESGKPVTTIVKIGTSTYWGGIKIGFLF